MMEINGYEVYQLEQQSTPIRTVYRGHHKKRQPQRACKIEAIFDEDVPQCYKHMECSNYYITQPQILLKHIFITPQHPNQIFFVEYQPAQSRNFLDLDFQRSLLCIFQIAKTAFHIQKRGLIHDFSLQNIAIGKEITYFYNFVKNGGEVMGRSEIKSKLELIISQLLHTQMQIAGQFKVDIDDNSVSLQWKQRIGANQIQMGYCFKYNQHNNEVIGIQSKRSLNGIVIDAWEKQIAANQLINFIPSYDSKSTEWYIPLNVKDKKPTKCVLQVDEAGKTEKEVTIKDTNQSFPYNSVGTIISLMKSQNGQKHENFGTAVLVSNNLILTCAHNILKQKDGIIYSADADDIKFYLNGKTCAIQRFELKNQYRQNIETNKRYEYDYALLKLNDEDKIEMNLYVEIVYNYKQTEMELKLKGFYRKEEIIKSKIIASAQLKFQENKKQLSYGYASKEEASQGGFSGGPIFIILAELDFGFKYHFVIGIHNSGDVGKNGYATYFNQTIIDDLAIWEDRMTKKVNNKDKVFSNILDFSKITNLDSVCEGMRSKLDNIVFNIHEKQYFPKIFAQAKDKQASRQHTENMYKKAIGQQIAQKKNEILFDLGSFTFTQRHNNVIFMYHLRKFQDWHAPWQAFGQSEGFFIFFIYIIFQLEYFFKHAKVSKQREPEYKKFLEFLQMQKDTSYQNRKYCQIAAVLIQIKLPQIQTWLQEISMNGNFKKLLFMEIQLMKLLGMLFAKKERGKKIFEVSKVCVLGFLAKEFFTKIVEVNKELNEYLYVLNEIILVSITFLTDQNLLEARLAKFSFAWSVRMLIKEHSSIRDDLLRFDPSHQALMNEQARDRQLKKKLFVLQHYFGKQVQDYMRNCMKLLYE